MIINAIKENLDQLTDLLRRLSAVEYVRPCEEISGASIGEHMRHIIEMFQVLESSYVSGIIEYDNRNRNLALQSDPNAALAAIETLSRKLDKATRTMTLLSFVGGRTLEIPTNYERELLYNLEHSIHHQALIKVAVRGCAAKVDASFGVAKSTLEFRKQCAQ